MKTNILLVVLSLLTLSFISTDVISETQTPNEYIKVFYFHGDIRCASCTTIEELTTVTINEVFEKELKSQKVVFKVLNIDKKENERYIEKYDLYNQALIIAHIKDSKQIKYKNCELIWEKLSDPGDFRDYVIKEINEYLKEI